MSYNLAQASKLVILAPVTVLTTKKSLRLPENYN